MTLKNSIEILMKCATNDVTGQGCGYRVTTDEWRDKVYEAWRVAFIHVNKREPYDSDYFNANMQKRSV